MRGKFVRNKEGKNTNATEMLVGVMNSKPRR